MHAVNLRSAALLAVAPVGEAVPVQPTVVEESHGSGFKIQNLTTFRYPHGRGHGRGGGRRRQMVESAALPAGSDVEPAGRRRVGSGEAECAGPTRTTARGQTKGRGLGGRADGPTDVRWGV